MADLQRPRQYRPSRIDVFAIQLQIDAAVAECPCGGRVYLRTAERNSHGIGHCGLCRQTYDVAFVAVLTKRS